MDDPYRAAALAAAALRRRFGIERIELAMVLGSGWAQAAKGLGTLVDECPLAELPGFAAPVVTGHGGALRLIHTESGSLAAIFTGRTHLYEGRGVAPVVHGVRTAAAAGASKVVLTNGCGGIDHPPGAPVLIADQINLTGATPLVGARFIDMTEVYSTRLRALARDLDPSLAEGVYCQFHGPAYETPAEVRMAKAIGGTLVGMSTALEAIAAREAGLEVLGISLVTNAAAGMTSEPLTHAEVIAAGRAAQPRLRTLLAGLIERL